MKYLLAIFILGALALMFAYLRQQAHRPASSTSAGGNGKSGDKNVDWWTSTITDIVRRETKESRDGQAKIIEILQRIDTRIEAALERRSQLRR